MIEQLRTMLHDYIDDSIDQLIDDDYDDVRDDIERVKRLIESNNIVHVLYMYEQTITS